MKASEPPLDPPPPPGEASPRASARTSRPRRLWLVVAAALATVALVAAGAAWQTCGFARCPDVEALVRYQPRGASLLLDRHGTPFAQLSPVEYRVVRLHEMPNHVPEAFVAIEDRRFHQHGGVDWRRVGGAFLANLRAGGVEEGASTITMQLARNLFPRALPAEERGLRRKLLEARVAQAIERRFSKAEILELYVNHIYFGNGARGIAAGARHYFGREASELTLAQAALLAALPKAPSHYDPRRHPGAARERRDLVLATLAEQGRVAEDAATAARAQPLGVRPPPHEPGPGEGAWFAAAVRAELEEALGRELWEQPVRVWTTLDLPLQRVAEDELRRQLAAVEGGLAGPFRGPLYSPAAEVRDDAAPAYLQGAMVVLDAAGGDVLAWVGGRDYRHSPFDRVADTHRQPGSAFKPFVYAAALAAGHPPSEPLDDSPLEVRLSDGSVWRPRNPSGRFAGRLSLREALVQSKNVATVRLAERLGHESMASLMARSGIETPLPRHPSAALGTASVSLLELTAAYTTFANLGRRVEPRLVLRIERADGSLLRQTAVAGERVLEPGVAYLVVDVLRDALARGTGAAAGVRSNAAAGKTGTSDGGADAWFVGLTPRRVAGVWIGFDEPRAIAPAASGGRLAAPVWGRVLRRAGGMDGEWPRPSTVVERPYDPRTGFPAAADCPGARELPRDLFLTTAMAEERCPGETPREPPLPQMAEASADEDELAAESAATVSGGIGASAVLEELPRESPAPPTRSRSAEQQTLRTPGSAPPAEAAPADEATSAPAPSQREPATSAAAPALDGWWELTTRIAESNVSKFEGLRLGYRLHLRQDGDRVIGEGQKWLEGGETLPPRRRTPIMLSGTLDGDRLRLSFTERGSRRPSAGTMTLRWSSGRRLSGSFASDAAASSGSATLRPLP